MVLDICGLQCHAGEHSPVHVGDRFIATNFMPLHLDCNPADMADDLDFFAWDSYPITGWDKTHRTRLSVSEIPMPLE